MITGGAGATLLLFKLGGKVAHALPVIVTVPTPP